jgi:hypothetical protein
LANAGNAAGQLRERMMQKIYSGLHYGAGGLLILLGVLGECGVTFPGVEINPHVALLAGLGIFGVGGKADAAMKFAFPFALTGFLSAIGIAIAPGVTVAADINKAAASPAGCSVSYCVGAFVGGTVINSGGNIDIIGTGLQGLAENGIGLGVQAGYEYWDGKLYAAALAPFAYNVNLNAPPQSGISNKVSYGVIGRVGVSLSSAFGLASTSGTPVTLPQQLLSSLMTPYVNFGIMSQYGQASLVSGAGVEALIATNWTLNADYLHYSFGSGGSSGGAIQHDTNEFRLSINRHFGM